MIQTIAERIVDKVDDEMKPQIIHWAAHYVSSAAAREGVKAEWTGIAHETRVQEDLPHRGVHRQGHEVRLRFNTFFEVPMLTLVVSTKTTRESLRSGSSLVVTSPDRADQ
jgi:hypothetical protein